MAAAALNNPPPLFTKKNEIWIDTYYFTIFHDLTRQRPGFQYETQFQKIKYLKGNFKFYVVVLSPNVLATYAIRTFVNPEKDKSDPEDCRYCVQFQFTISGLGEEPRNCLMHWDEEIAYAVFRLNSDDQYSERGNLIPVYDLKVIVKMVAYECLSTYAHEKLGDFFSKAKAFYRDKEAVKDWEQILGCTDFVCLFTGREGKDGKVKQCMIYKSLLYARPIAAYLNAKARGDLELPKLDLDTIVPSILGESKKFEGPDCLSKCQKYVIAYYRAYRIGLDFLRVIIRDKLMDMVEDKDNVTRILKIADMADDPILFDKAAKYFVLNMRDIKETDGWDKLCKSYWARDARIICRAILTRLKHNKLHIPNKIELQTEL